MRTQCPASRQGRIARLVEMDGGWGKRDMGWKTLLVALPGEEKSWYMSIVHCPDCMNLELVQLVHFISGASLVIGHKLAGEEENIGRPLTDYKSTHSRLYHIRCTHITLSAYFISACIAYLTLRAYWPESPPVAFSTALGKFGFTLWECSHYCESC